MTFLETVKYARLIVEKIDANDEKAIAFLKMISEFPLMPSYIKVAVLFLEKIEPSVVKTLISAIEIAEGFATKSTVKISSDEKLQVAANEVKKETGILNFDLIKQGVSLVNKFIKL